MANLFNNKNDKIDNKIRIKYSGPSFNDGSFDLRQLHPQLKAIDNLITESLKEHKIKDVEVRVYFEQGSFESIIELINDIEGVINDIEGIVRVINFIIQELNKYKKDKNPTSTDLPNHKNIIGPIKQKGDSVSIKIEDNNAVNFNLNYSGKDEYERNLQPSDEDEKDLSRVDESVVLYGKLRKLDFNAQKYNFGFDTEINGKERKGIPTSIKGVSNPSTIPGGMDSIMDTEMKAIADITYNKKGEVTSLEISNPKIAQKRIKF